MILASSQYFIYALFLYSPLVAVMLYPSYVNLHSDLGYCSVLVSVDSLFQCYKTTSVYFAKQTCKPMFEELNCSGP